MKPSLIAFMLAGLLLVVGPVAAQQPERGPNAAGSSPHPLRSEETGTRGPSGSSPETGYHGPRDPATDTEPGKPKSKEELRQSGTTQPSKTN